MILLPTEAAVPQKVLHEQFGIAKQETVKFRRLGEVTLPPLYHDNAEPRQLAQGPGSAPHRRPK
jgi:hypothetical protein